MAEAARADRVVDTFATLADTLVDGYDVVDLLQTLVEACHTLLDVSAAGILLADQNHELDVLASTSEGSALIETIRLGAIAGPNAESFATGIVVEIEVLDEGPDAWRAFLDHARALDFASTVAIPMRLRERTIGVLNLFRMTPGRLPSSDLRTGRALADVATIGILHERTLRESTLVQRHLTHALNSRIVIEQAKGALSHTHGLSMDDAFALLRNHARSTRTKLSDVAARVVDRSLTI